MKNPLTTVALSVFLATAFTPAATAQGGADPLSAEETRDIATDAYLYFYPLVTMDVTRRQLTNEPPGSFIGGPMNTFSNVSAFPDASMKSVVRPNFDTLYSSAYLDLTKEPMVVSVPDTDGRYYLLPMLDMWTNVFASPGSRTTGTQAGNFLVTPQGWRPDLRERFVEELRLPKNTQRIDAPTPYVWIIGRTKTDGPSDYDAVHKIQAGFKITPLSEWGRTPTPVTAKVDPSIDMKTPPKTQVDAMPANKYFAYAAELLRLHPPHVTDQPIIAQLRRIGFEPGKSFDLAKLDPAVRTAFEEAPANAQKLMEWKLPSLARVANNWSMNTDTMGVYGNYYLKRALIAQQGLGANLPEDAIYPLNLGDAAGKPLDGASKYVLRFAKDTMPPVNAFWSVTLYDSDGFQVANPLNRFALSSWMPFKQDSDGSLTLYVQNESPGKENEANWLPAPKGPFNLTMRLYAPKPDALTGRWNPPPVQPAAEGRAVGGNR
jgi:hypothetical protein